MSTPGGPYWQEPQPQYQVDPMTGQPAPFQGQPQQQQPYGGYQGFGMYQPPEPPKSNNAPWIIALVALLVLGGGGVGAYFLLSEDDTPEQAPIAGPASSSSAPTTTKGKPSPTKTTAKKPTTNKTPTEVEEIKVDAVTPGFQGVLSYKENVAYDVPTDWKIETPGMVVGFEDNAGKPKAIMHGVSTYRENACTNVRGSYRGHVGLVSVENLDLTLGAKNGVKVFAEAAALNKDDSKAPVTYTEPVATKVGQGKIDAMTAKGTLTVNQPGECASPTVEFTSVAFKIEGGKTAIFISYMDQGVPDALPAETLQKIIASLRIYKE
ncbi:hypothetical protein [Actinokineospora xionganensis]|uniref:DUF8017 domain-containing protein n=1 Tax=Actinokineospora xionganensis TaxID=2684470 RepID=A0ABR7L9H1_9PSEU|nr:hypothetical protein [Actinokineospora xionganensis]MBC6449356.1 hypothetical protein [Actinokineospora xionganensis]